MNVPFFVTCSAAFLAAWLGVTFFRDVPREAYPLIGQDDPAASAEVAEATPAETTEPTKPLISLESQGAGEVVLAD